MFRNAPPEVLHQLGGKVADALASERAIELNGGTTGEVEDGASKCFIHGNIGVSVPRDERLVAKGFAECLAEDDSDILDRMVVVYVEVAGGLHSELQPAVPREQVQHVIQEPDACLVVVARCIRVEVDLDTDGCFGSRALDASVAAWERGMHV